VGGGSWEVGWFGEREYECGMGISLPFCYVVGTARSGLGLGLWVSFFFFFFCFYSIRYGMVGSYMSRRAGVLVQIFSFGVTNVCFSFLVSHTSLTAEEY